MPPELISGGLGGGSGDMAPPLCLLGTRESFQEAEPGTTRASALGEEDGCAFYLLLTRAACPPRGWLVEETFTVDEVSEVLNGLQAVVHSEVESELINTAYTNVLLLRQLFSQAEKWYLKLQTDISELENRELLEQVAEFEKAEFTSSNKKSIIDSMKPKLAPLHEGGAAELLNKEIIRLQEENEKLKSRLKTIESQATDALDEKSKLERALQDLQLEHGSQKDFIKAQDLSDLENTVAALKSEFQKTLNDQTENQKSLEENLATAKHDLLRVQEQLSMAEKELEKKFQQTAAFRNMKEILTKKNDQIKDLRKRLAKYEPED